ncbi:MAG: carbohydrate-binding protein [Armatimonadetes bacterium]|nr:carbohydrate-binding protein [Armatimonadota bacterium]
MRFRSLVLFAAPALCLMGSALFANEFYVSTKGKDSNNGSRSAPLRTIQRGAELAKPGDVITVHQGVYRERINPPRGGDSDTKRIVYQAAKGEKVEIKGSEIVKNWVKVQDGVWKAVIPNSFFGSFNPYSDLIHGDWFDARGREHHTGAVYLNGEWLTEAVKLEEVMMPVGTVPAWLAQADGYLLNVAWLRPSGSENTQRIPAVGFTAKKGAQNAPCTEGGECIGWIANGDWVRYERVNFKRRTEQLEIRAASAADGGIIEVRLDAPDGELIGSCKVLNTGGWQSWSSFKAKIKPASGVKTLCLVFRSLRPAAVNTQLWFAQVDASNTTIWAQFKDIDPNKQLTEINVRQTVFYPEKPSVNFITVRGFTMRDAATPWAPPTAEQIGLIGTHWSKGWIIENNIISHSRCAGISLGKYGDEWDNKAESAEGYNKTIERALANGWNKETIGHHIVHNNTISHCEQAGIVGSLGAVFSRITGNTIHDIHVQCLFSGAEMAGIKLHAAIDVEISQNHIYRTCRGLWLDWMAQGTRVSGNLFHDNAAEDLFVEVDHGPFLVDNNIILSPVALLSVSQGGAYVHNLISGAINQVSFDGRMTPFHKAHSTEVAGLHDNPSGDNRFYNNILVERGDLSAYDTAKLPMWMDGNVFLKGAKPSKLEKDPLIISDFDPALRLLEKKDGFYLEFQFDKAWIAERKRQLVTTDMLGKATIPGLPYENPDGTPLTIDADYFGKERNKATPVPGPFESSNWGRLNLKVW